jgi:hypothetical protein
VLPNLEVTGKLRLSKVRQSLDSRSIRFTCDEGGPFRQHVLRGCTGVCRKTAVAVEMGCRSASWSSVCTLLCQRRFKRQALGGDLGGV